MLFALTLAVVGAILPAGAAQALPPLAEFGYQPEAPLSGEEVTFASESLPDPSDPARTIVHESWDLDNDGKFDDASGPTATWTFAGPGEKRVVLHVTDSAGETDTRSHHVQVVNRPPVAVFALVPTVPLAGQQIALVSSSYDPDGSIVATAWDLDGDGAFDDATGGYAARSFGAGGWVIALRVSDNSGANAFAVATLDIKDASAPVSGTGSATVISNLRLMSPFPIVRVRGTRLGRGTRLSLLSVSAPVGTLVSVRCSGRGCPFKNMTRSVKAPPHSAAGLAPGTGLVRVRNFGRRLLRPGASVRVFATRQGEIGKYTRLRIRRDKFPARVDRCVTPVNLVPLVCPVG